MPTAAITSPPKRMTRARAAAKKEPFPEIALDEQPAPSKKKSTKRSGALPADSIEENTESEMYPPRRPARKLSASTTLNAPPRRKVKVTPLNQTNEVDAEKTSEPSIDAANESLPTTARTKSSSMRAKDRRAVQKDGPTSDDTHAEIPSKPKTRAKAAAGTDINEVESLPPKTRSRSKKPIETKVAEDVQPEVLIANPRRTRAASGAAATRSTAASAAKRTMPPKKKVTFQEPSESDKENLPLPTRKGKAKKDSAQAPVNAPAKVTRKPISATVRGRKPAKAAQNEEKVEQAPQPLSPKKITQIAKSSSSSSLDSEEDELNGGRTPLRVPNQSPKRPIGLGSPVKKLDFASGVLPRSPVKEPGPTVMLSPPRRPPPSPFKDALKESPKRGDMPFVLPHSVQKVSKAASKSVQSQPSLQQSPKRGNINVSIFQNSTMKPSNSPMKASLLQSPARRLFSPEKSSNPSDFSKKTTDLGMQTPKLSATSHFKASSSRPESTVKVFADDPYVDQPNIVDFDQSVLNVRSPMKISPKKSARPEPSMIAEEETVPVIQNDLVESDRIMNEADDLSGHLEHVNTLNSDENLQIGVDPSEVMSKPATGGGLGETPRVRMTQHLFRSVSNFSDYESEDELQCDVTPVQRFGAAGRTPRTLKSTSMEAGTSPAKSGVKARALGYTPLAVQFGNWLAASPDKPLPKKGRRGVFSPVKALQSLSRDTDTAMEDATPSLVSPVKTALRKSIAGRKSFGGRRSIAGRVSIGASVAGTPGRPTFFEDEMALRELEEDFESQEAAAEEVPTAPENDAQVSQDSTNLEVDVGETDAPMAEMADDPLSDLIHEDVAYDDSVAHEEDQELEYEGVRFEGSAKLDDDAGAIDEPSVEVDISDEAQTSLDAQPTLDNGDERILNVQENAQNAIEPRSPSCQRDVEAIRSTELADGSLLQDHGVPSEPLTTGAAADAADADEELTSRLPLTDIDVKTPIRPTIAMSRFHSNTIVSKVPLRQEGQDSPLKMPRKRSRSLSADPRSPRKTVSFSPMKPQLAANPLMSSEVASSTAANYEPEDITVDDVCDIDVENLPPSTPNPASFTATAEISSSEPAIASTIHHRSPIKSTTSSILSGAVIFTDVHTSEGADASGIFVELLTQMGARCVKQWSWNPRASIMSPEGDNNALGSKVGITHVVYKDGGKRTLEKVRDAKGVVKCVGVAWVLDCEGRGEWVDESPYKVDLSTFPRGGSRRRKSMEPRALINQNGNLFEPTPQRRKSLGLASGLALGRRSISADYTPARKQTSPKAHAASSPITATSGPADERVTTAAAAGEYSPDVSISSTDSPAAAPTNPAIDAENIDGGDDSLVSSGFSTPTGVHSAAFAAQQPLPQTPTGHVAFDPSTSYSPDTPYLIGVGSRLVQMSCPPKQTREGLFSNLPRDRKIVGGDGEREGGRRKTLGLNMRDGARPRPRVGSALGREVGRN
ncbi:MAG: hypothetical protein Q9160_002571 [Pyrenula sp. 1 TL-2023]